MKLCKNCGASVYDIQTICHECNSPIETESKSTLTNNEGKTSYTSPSSFDSYHTYDVPNNSYETHSSATRTPKSIAPKTLSERIIELETWKKLLIIGVIIIIIIVIAALLFRKPARSDAPYAQPLYMIEDAYNTGDFQLIFDAMPTVEKGQEAVYNYLMDLIKKSYANDMEKMKEMDTTIILEDAKRLSETQILFYISSQGLNPATTTDGYALEGKIRVRDGFHIKTSDLHAVTLEIDGEWYLVEFEPSEY